MPPPETLLAWFAAALDQLPAFLTSSDTFRSLPGAPHGMRQDLSLGRLLLSADALEAARTHFLAADRSRWDELRFRWEAERTSHAAALNAKASAELPRRLGSWRAFLQELAETPSEAEGYALEVRHRVVIDRLCDVLVDRSPLGHGLDRLDQALRSWIEPGPFLWDDSLQSVYPEPRFWYLYGGPEPARILANPAKL